MRFIITLVAIGVSAWGIVAPAQEAAPGAADSLTSLSFSLDLRVAQAGFDHETCWVHARAGAIPPGKSGNASTTPCVVMTMQKLQLSGSDVFEALSEVRSSDGAQTWTAPRTHDSFARQTYRRSSGPLPTGAEIAQELLRDGDQTLVCDFTPQWHLASERLLGIGHTAWYRDQRVTKIRPRGIAYAVYNSPEAGWSQWRTVQLPALDRFKNAGAGSAQRVDLPGGDVLVPIYFKEPAGEQYSVTICRCRFDGRSLEYVTHGNELTIPSARGLYEPSLTRYQGRYYLTLRNDLHGYVTSSDDGLHFDSPRKWTFDDGSELGNYNTQQHWVTHSHGLYLVYTRRGANNDHVFRHRAPLFIAQVDPDDLQVKRSSEQVLVPERGARLGNFGVVDVSPEETWVTAAEWMQPVGVESHGSDNSIFVAKLKWSQPNQLFGTNEATQPGGKTVEQGNEEKKSAAWSMIEPYTTPPLIRREQFGDYRSPLIFQSGGMVESAADWPARRAEIFSDWQQLLGQWPPLITQPQVTILDTSLREQVTQHRIRFRWMPDAETTGYLLIPNGQAKGKRPAVITVYYEPETAIGQGAEFRDFAWQLAQRGFVTLSIGTTEATQAKTYALYYPNLENAQVQPLSMLAYAAANAWHVLAARPEVDPERIGIVGHSFGGKWAMFAACLFDKFACAAWSDPGSVFDPQRSNVNYWEPWYLGYHPPPWRERGLVTPQNPARGLYPRLIDSGRDLHELHALLAPRPFLVSGGAEDPPRRWEALNHALKLYRLMDADGRVAMTNRPDHSPNADSNSVLYAFFEYWLNAGHP